MHDDYNFDENDIEYVMDMYSDATDDELDDDEIDSDDEQDSDDQEDDYDDKSDSLTAKYKAVNVTAKYLNAQMEKMEPYRDRIKFYYNKELICGHVVGKFSSSGKYTFATIDLKTGAEKLRNFTVDLIENY